MRRFLLPAAVGIIGFAAVFYGLTLGLAGSGTTSGVAGSYPSELNLQSDPCGHDPFIFSQEHPSHNMKLTVVVDAQFISIQGPSPWVKVSTTQFPGAGLQFTASGSGTVAGVPNTVVQFQGSISGNAISGKYSFGSDDPRLPPGQGGLPPCGPPGTVPVPHAAVYGVKPKVTSTPTRTRTRTPTPPGTPPKLYSIVVLKLNDNTKFPVPNWPMNLYLGSDCHGNPIDSGATNDTGLIDFTGLSPGLYSVSEKMLPGWNPDGPVCQNVNTAVAGTPAGLPPCPIQPDADFPQPGCDSFLSGARVNIEINATGSTYSVTLNGPTLIARNNAPHKVDGRDQVDTEVVAMQLTGASPFGVITVRESPTRRSLGNIREQTNNAPSEMQFPANSFFDVFFEVDLPQLGMTLHNEAAFRVECKIERIPPYLCFYLPPIREPITLYNAAGMKIAKIMHAVHIPLPPNETFIVFSNRPKGTVTPTTGGPTSTPTRTPTRTPTPCGAIGAICTPTPTRTATATLTGPTSTPAATPVNPPPNGACTKIGQDIVFSNNIYDQWKCSEHDLNFPFNRVDISIGTANQQMKLDPTVPPKFRCQSTNEVATGSFKGHKKNVNPGTTLPNHEVWSADFFEKCTQGVTVYLHPANPDNHAVIQEVAFTNTSHPTPTATSTATPTPCGVVAICTPTPTPTPIATPCIGATGVICTPTPTATPCIGAVGVICTPTPTATPCIGATGVICTPTPPATPRPTNPPPNGQCTKAKQNVLFQDKTWDLWSCNSTSAALAYNRVDVSISMAGQDAKLRAMHVLCLSTNEKAAGEFKLRKKNVSPGTSLPNHEVWSAELSHKCSGKLRVYLQPTNPDNHPLIAQVFFSNVAVTPQPTATATRTPTRTPTATPTRTPTPHKVCGDVNDDGHVNSVDASLLLQVSAGRVAQLPNMASADTNHDGSINAIDATVVLQIDAGLLARCRPATAGTSAGRGSIPLWASALW